MSVSAPSLSLPRAPWRDRRGRISALRIVALVLLAWPAALLLLRTYLNRLGAEPFAEAINATGTAGIRILVASLAITPLRRLYDWPRLVDVRRMVGVTAFLYLLAHLTLYAVQQADLVKVVTEIAFRFYLTIGFVALLGLAALAATSTDAMVRRLGAERWRTLHRIVYVLMILALTHELLQARLQDYFDPILLGGFTLFLFLMRWATPKGLISPWRALGLAVVASLATAGGEALYLGIRVGADPLTVAAAQLSAATGVRPAQVVFAVTVAVALGALLRRRRAARPA